MSSRSARGGCARGERAERGIALLTAIILVAIAAVLATAIGFASAMSAHRASTVFGADQSMLVAEGAEAMAAYVLEQSGPNAGQVSLNQPWAQSYGPFELLPGVTLEHLQLEDEQSKFNINNLAAAAGGNSNTAEITQFQQLLGLLGLESKWAPLAADWIDSDDTPNFPDGAEDSVYLSQMPPYHTANLPVTSISELLALPGFGRNRYNRLAPYITALPPGTQINVCTASGVVLDAISGKVEYSNNEQQLQLQRQQQGCFPTISVFQASLSNAQQSQGAVNLSQVTSYFRLRTIITIGTARFSLYSLLQRDGAGQIHVVLRTFGTE
ncbi:MAG TPA: type II secretion system minor pseudopilin GspK [Steroidobacteraceae bacterium]